MHKASGIDSAEATSVPPSPLTPSQLSPTERSLQKSSAALPSLKRKRDENTQKYYAVRSGKTPGIYLSWDECKLQVHGFTGAMCKSSSAYLPCRCCPLTHLLVRSFNSQQEAEDFMNGKNPQVNGKNIKFYAVAAGKVPGIYTDWTAVQDSVYGFKGPKFRKFATWAEAANYIRENGDAAAIAALAKQEEQMDISYEEPPAKKSKEESFAEEENYVTIYTDGSCISNGKHGARAGIGVYFGDGDERHVFYFLDTERSAWTTANAADRNIAERLKGEVQTNQRAELTAVLRALEQVADSQSVIIHTDSKYTIDCLTDWYKGWQQKGWRSSTGEAVKNQDIIKPIIKKIYEDRLREGALTDFKWVKGHSTTYGNQQADMLAVKGAKMP